MASNMTRHPRRPPADKSVSLLHSPRARLQHQQRQQPHGKQDAEQPPASVNADRNSPTNLSLLAGKHSSGESSNAELWFDKSNNRAAKASNTLSDNDPPFFLQNSSSSEEQADGQHSAYHHRTNPDLAESLAPRPMFPHLGTDGSSTEDFRGVIDDLTIENKKLKRRLKKYEKLHDAHLKDEKLFEVRIHALPPDKKRELEETLRKFAIELAPHSQHGAAFPESRYLRGPLIAHKSASSSASLHNTDSAYASMSASGQGSSGHSDSRHSKPAKSERLRHQSIHTYLHHIPEGLLPQQNPETISEKAKRKLVVRRLEQIFAGKGAAKGGHQQALQQQGVSQSAARADRVERDGPGQSSRKEGIREASIMRTSGKDMSSEEQSSTRAVDNAATADVAAVEVGVGGAVAGELAARSPTQRGLEQRPTRPLDLDPHRAQIPVENLRYMRHLGFTLPDPGVMSPTDDEGWIYLNLLISMAQLHTINVTHDFVRDSIGQFSDKFEISEDGRKVRWMGGRSVTRTSSHDGGSSVRTDEDSGQSPRKRMKMTQQAKGARSMLSRNIPGSRPPPPDSGRFAYTPMFFHRDSTSDDISSSEMDEEEEDSVPFAGPAGGESSAMTSSAVWAASTRRQKAKDDGPIIFYSNARFCTDLSGYSRPAISPGAPIYKPANVLPLGMPGPAFKESFFESRGPLAETFDLPEPMDIADNPIPDSLELDFSETSSVIGEAGVSQKPIDFEVSGIGGVFPADHFAVTVESRHVVVTNTSAQHVKVLPPRLAKFFDKPEQRTVDDSKSITTRHMELPPSALPEALSYMATGRDSESDDGSDVEHMLVSEGSFDHMLPSLAAPQQLDLLYNDVDASDADVEDYEKGGDEESNESVDLLAVARKLDPDAVRAREREYDANLAERLAEDIPAGSSAATAGGGSGFASPASGVDKTAYRQAMRAANARRPALTKRETTDSMAVGLQDSSVDEDDDQGRSVRS